MVKSRSRRHAAGIDENALDLRLQKKIFLCTFSCMVLFLVSLYLAPTVIIPAILGVILLTTTGYFYYKHKDFYKLRDRGQRTWCVTIAMYISIIVTIACAYYFAKDGTLTLDYALVFLFGFMFFTYMIYRTLSPSMVVGNKRQRIKQ